MPDLRTAARRAGQLAGAAVGEFFRDGCPQRAAAISYYALFSLFPLAILAVAGIGLLIDDQSARDRVIQTVIVQLPLQEDQGRRELEALLREVTAKGGAFSLVGGLGLLFAASGVMGAIRHALNAAWDVGDSRPPVQGKLVDIVLVIGFGALVTASLALTLVLRLTDQATDLFGDAGRALDVVVLELSRLAPTALALVTFTVIFRFIPAARPPLRDIWPGVLVATAGYELSKAAFAFYLDNFARYGTVYASLGTAVAFMAFVFVAANIALLGAETAAEWPGVREGRDDRQGPRAPLRRRVRTKVRSLFVRRDPRPTPADRALGRHERATRRGQV